MASSSSASFREGSVLISRDQHKVHLLYLEEMKNIVGNNSLIFLVKLKHSGNDKKNRLTTTPFSNFKSYI